MATHTPSQRAHGLGVVTAVGDLGNLSSSSSGGVESPPLMDPHHGDSLLFLRGIPNVEQWWDQLGSQDDYEDMVDELADLACVDDSDSGISECSDQLDPIRPRCDASDPLSLPLRKRRAARTDSAAAGASTTSSLLLRHYSSSAAVIKRALSRSGRRKANLSPISTTSSGLFPGDGNKEDGTPLWGRRAVSSYLAVPGPTTPAAMSSSTSPSPAGRRHHRDGSFGKTPTPGLTFAPTQKVLLFDKQVAPHDLLSQSHEMVQMFAFGNEKLQGDSGVCLVHPLTIKVLPRRLNSREEEHTPRLGIVVEEGEDEDATQLSLPPSPMIAVRPSGSWEEGERNSPGE